MTTSKQVEFAGGGCDPGNRRSTPSTCRWEPTRDLHWLSLGANMARTAVVWGPPSLPVMCKLMCRRSLYTADSAVDASRLTQKDAISIVGTHVLAEAVLYAHGRLALT